MLHALADGIEVLAPATEPAASPIAVGGADADAVVPSQRHLSIVRDPA
jgi:hypothetical protein